MRILGELRGRRIFGAALIIVLIAVLAGVWWHKNRLTIKSGADLANEYDRAIEGAARKKGAPLTEAELLSLLPTKVSRVLSTASKMDIEDVSFYAVLVLSTCPNPHSRSFDACFSQVSPLRVTFKIAGRQICLRSARTSTPSMNDL